MQLNVLLEYSGVIPIPQKVSAIASFRSPANVPEFHFSQFAFSPWFFYSN